jgi:hypothetical protein
MARACFDEHPMPSLAWMDCRFLRDGRDRACLRKRIVPAQGKERVIRPCDVCPRGTARARTEATHARRMNARALGLKVIVAI